MHGETAMALIQILEKTISPGEQQFLSLRAWRFLLNVKRLLSLTITWTTIMSDEAKKFR